jgi:hypothetical protein
MCNLCGLGDDHANIILCDKCDGGYHMYCLQPPMDPDNIPEGDWFCSHNGCVGVVEEEMDLYGRWWSKRKERHSRYPGYQVPTDKGVLKAKPKPLPAPVPAIALEKSRKKNRREREAKAARKAAATATAAAAAAAATEAAAAAAAVAAAAAAAAQFEASHDVAAQPASPPPLGEPAGQAASWLLVVREGAEEEAPCALKEGGALMNHDAQPPPAVEAKVVAGDVSADRVVGNGGGLKGAGWSSVGRKSIGKGTAAAVPSLLGPPDPVTSTQGTALTWCPVAAAAKDVGDGSAKLHAYLSAAKPLAFNSRVDVCLSILHEANYDPAAALKACTLDCERRMAVLVATQQRQLQQLQQLQPATAVVPAAAAALASEALKPSPPLAADSGAALAVAASQQHDAFQNDEGRVQPPAASLPAAACMTNPTGNGATGLPATSHGTDSGAGMLANDSQLDPNTTVCVPSDVPVQCSVGQVGAKGFGARSRGGRGRQPKGSTYGNGDGGYGPPPKYDDDNYR